MKNLAKEFKEFAMRGSVMDLAIGVIIGAAFGKITTSLVNDIINPILGLIIGKLNFSNLFIDLSTMHFESIEEAKLAGVATINYGLFLNTILDFVITAFALFLIIKQLNRLRRKHDTSKEASPTTKKCQFCYSEINIKATKCPNCTSSLS
jgi:large conductance mechanosensitive channel